MEEIKFYSIGNLTLNTITPLVRAMLGSWIDASQEVCKNQIVFDTRKDLDRTWGHMIRDIHQEFNMSCEVAINAVLKNMITKLGYNDVDQLISWILPLLSPEEDKDEHLLTALEVAEILSKIDDGHGFQKINFLNFNTCASPCPEENGVYGNFSSRLFHMESDANKASEFGEKMHSFLSDTSEQSLKQAAHLLRRDFELTLHGINDTPTRDKIRKMIFG